jgi:5'-nucleotidase
MKKPRIMVTNDDGWSGPGLRPLIAAMKRLGSVTTCVPHQERSADSHSLTLHKPLRIHHSAPGFYALNGSPADCARFGILEILKGRVDLVVSGINRGYNLGEDVIYSGTVAAAMEATLLGIPSIALSQDPDAPSFTQAAAYARRIARLTLKQRLPEGIFLNVNFPAVRKYRGAQAVRLGRRVYSKDVTKRLDPRGGHYYWLAGKTVEGVAARGTDVSAVVEGYVSVTPLHIDNTDPGMLQSLRSWPL